MQGPCRVPSSHRPYHVAVTVEDVSGAAGDDVVIAELFANVESLADEASRTSELAMTLRGEIEQARHALSELHAAHAAQITSIEADIARAKSKAEKRMSEIAEELLQAQSDADTRSAAIAQQLAGAQLGLNEVRRAQMDLESEVTDLERRRDDVRTELAGLQDRLVELLPGIDRLRAAQRELAEVLAPRPQDDAATDPDDEPMLPSRPLGRSMAAAEDEPE